MKYSLPVFVGLRRIAVLAIAGIHAIAAAQPSQTVDLQCKQMARGYPSRPVTLVVGFPPGGQTDQIARIVADALGKRLGQSVVIDNRAGAGGTIGAAYVAKAAADGQTLYLATMGTHAINSSLYSKLPYDHLKDFKAVAYVTSAPNVFLARSDSPVKSMADLASAVKSKSRPINMALPGNGTSPHLSAALFEYMAGIHIQSVMYRGNAPALTDVLGGNVEFLVDSVTTALPYIQRGSLRALAVTSSKRSPLLPKVPTVAEYLVGYELNGWWGIVAPSATPDVVVERLNCEVNQALKEPKIIDRFKAMGALTQEMSPKDFSQLIARDTVKWERVIRAANIKIE
jgi:tripartite-type tricarboxylate transporter receptor subunit TctC